MSTEFSSKQDALNAACMYAGVNNDVLKEIIPKKEMKYHPLDDKRKYPEEIETYIIKNKNGENAEFAIGTFRNGFDLWLIGQNGFMMRV